MAAYVIARVEVTDPVKYEGYKALTPGAIAAAGGRFIVRGGRTRTVEGEAEPRRIVVIEFKDFAAAEAFYASALYQAAKAKREGAANAQIVIVEGV